MAKKISSEFDGDVTAQIRAQIRDTGGEQSGDVYEFDIYGPQATDRIVNSLRATGYEVSTEGPAGFWLKVRAIPVGTPESVEDYWEMRKREG